MLTEEQEQQIIEKVSSSKLKNRRLRDDLIDHLCCLTEINMDQGQEFENAYEKALNQTAPNGLEEIQKETIFLLNYHKIMFMKRLMYGTGYLFALTAITGVFLKLMHFPGAALLSFIGGLGFAFVFLPLLIINRYKKFAHQVMTERLRWILGVSSAMLFMLASVMKIFHLQGAALMLFISFLVFGFGFLPFLFFRMYKKSITEL